MRPNLRHQITINFAGAQAFTSIEAQIIKALKQDGYDYDGAAMGLWPGAERELTFTRELPGRDPDAAQIHFLIHQAAPDVGALAVKVSLCV